MEEELGRYDCRRNCANVNMIDLLIERRALETGREKGELVRDVYWALAELWESGHDLEELQQSPSDPKRREKMDDVLDTLHSLLDEVRGRK